MFRVPCQPRADLYDIADKYGFNFHTIDGEPYWDETAYYQFTLKQIEDDLEAPTEELEQLCLALVDEIVRSEQLLTKMQVPERYWDYIHHSWVKKSPHLYGRMDFSYNGTGPAKFLEYNADTPTSLYEAAFFQWLWLEHQVDRGHLHRDADQFNSIQEKLVSRFMELDWPSLYFACCKDTDEDRGTVMYLEDCARQAGKATQFIFMEDIGVNSKGQYTDLGDTPIPALFKLYPWEFMFEDSFGYYLPHHKGQFLEPAWKALLSNKAILPLLWQRHPNHPNLLPSYFEGEEGEGLAHGYVRKPLFSREGANISYKNAQGTLLDHVGGTYGGEGYIIQAAKPLPKFDDNYTLIGSWLVNSQAAGLTIREDKSLITQDSSRFIPHIILN